MSLKYASGAAAWSILQSIPARGPLRRGNHVYWWVSRAPHPALLSSSRIQGLSHGQLLEVRMQARGPPGRDVCSSCQIVPVTRLAANGWKTTTVRSPARGKWPGTRARFPSMRGPAMAPASRHPGLTQIFTSGCCCVTRVLVRSWLLSYK